MILRHDKHTLNAIARPLLTKLHLQDGVVYGLARNLSSEVVQLSV